MPTFRSSIGLLLVSTVIVSCGGEDGAIIIPASSVVSGSAETTLPILSPSVVSGNAKITLNWIGLTNTASYTVCHATQSLGNPADLANCSAHTNGTLIQNQTGSSHTVTGLTNGTTYYFALMAVDTTGNESQPSAQVSATPTTRINDTGITFGGNYPTGNNRTENNPDCTGDTNAEQDCSHGRDVTNNDDSDGHAGFSFTKLDASGNTLSETGGADGIAWSCVQDNVTGLVWEVKTNAADGVGLHDKADKYNWYSTNSSTNGGAVGYADADGNICEGYVNGQLATYCNTQAFTARVNAVVLCGAADWRLPTITELMGIANNGTTNPSIDTRYFPNTEVAYYWSSSPYASNDDRAWVVYFSKGDDANGPRDDGYRIRLVRSGQ
jgi:hypothetical protein